MLNKLAIKIIRAYQKIKISLARVVVNTIQVARIMDLSAIKSSIFQSYLANLLPDYPLQPFH